MTPVPAPVRRRRLLAGVVAVVAGGVFTAAVVGASTAPADVLAEAQESRAVCLVLRRTAVTSAQKTRAQTCVADMDRVIADLTQPDPSPVPSPTGGGGFPSAATTGTPAGWVPKVTRTTDLRVTVAGTVVEDVRFVDADLIIDAVNVTVRRVELQGGGVNNVPNSTCRNGLLLEDVRFGRAPGQVTRTADVSAIVHGGYTARRVEIVGLPEAFRVGGASSFKCGPVVIEDSYVLVNSPDICGDWHGDGVQGYDGPALTVRNVTLDLDERAGCGGTAPYFYPRNQGNTSAVVDGLLVKGGGYPFRLGMPATVKGLRIVDGSWGYGPIDVRCSVVTAWEAQIVTIDPATYAVTGVVRNQPCDTESGS